MFGIQDISDNSAKPEFDVSLSKNCLHKGNAFYPETIASKAEISRESH